MEEVVIVTSVLVATTNAAVICMVIFIKELRTFTNYFVLSLAVSDMLTGAVLPLNRDENQVNPKVTGYFVCVVMLSGVGNLCALTWDRYVAVVDPFGYKNRMRKCHKKILFAIWITTLSWSLVPASWNMDSTHVLHRYFLVISFAVFVIIPYVFIVVAYVRIWLRLRSHAAEMKNRNITNEQREGARRASLEGKTVKVFIVVVSVFLVSWLPVIYMTIVPGVANRPDLVPFELPLISVFTIAGSSLINPMIYAFKKDFIEQLSRLRIRNSRLEPQS